MILSTQKRTSEQNVKFHILINDLRYSLDEKVELVGQFSGYRAKSSKELTYSEMAALIKYLEEQKNGSIKRMRSKIINIAKDIGLCVQTGEVDWTRLNTFMVSKFKKKLHELSREELPKAVTAMEAWRDTNTKKQLSL